MIPIRLRDDLLIPVTWVQGDVEVKVAGTSFHQSEIEAIAGEKTAEGHFDEHSAILMPEPTNPADPNAVQVTINGELVGYLPKHLGRIWQPLLFLIGKKYGRVVACQAIITGGWSRGGRSEGKFGVTLILPPAVPADLAFFAERKASVVAPVLAVTCALAFGGCLLCVFSAAKPAAKTAPTVTGQLIPDFIPPSASSPASKPTSRPAPKAPKPSASARPVPKVQDAGAPPVLVPWPDP